MPEDKDFELDDLDSFSFDEISLDGNEPASEPQESEDKYGVWVKGEPEDVKDELEVGEDDLLPPQEEPPLAEDDFLSSEELANLDDQFDFVTVSEEPLEGETLDQDDIPLPPGDPDEPQILSVDDFEDTPHAPPAAGEKKSVAPEPTASDELPQNSFDEISLDDFVTFDDDEAAEPKPAAVNEAPASPLATEDELNEEFLDIDIEIEDEIDDEELEILEGAQVVREEAQSFEPVEGAEEIDLSEFADFGDEPALETPEVSQEDSPVSLEIDHDVQSFETVEAFENADLNADDLSLDSIEIPAADDLGEINLEPQDEMDMNHILALEEDLTSGIRSPADEPILEMDVQEDSVAQEAPVAQQTEETSMDSLDLPEPPLEAVPAPAAASVTSAVNDLATQILSKIESELSSIKQEITELKKEVTTLRLPSKEEAAVEEKVEEKKPHGFFDEEDDETIALTGDELDNILSTAEISEGEEVGETLDDDFVDESATLASQDLIQTDPEGNIVDEPQHVTDEEFLAGTSLELDTGDAQLPPSQEEILTSSVPEEDLGIPASIELEESLPEQLEGQSTENLMESDGFDLSADDLSLAPAEIEMESPELAIPFDDEVHLDDEVQFDITPPVEDEVSFDTEPYIESPAHEELNEVIIDEPQTEAPQETVIPPVEEETVPKVSQPLPPPPQVTAPQGKGMGALSPSMKEELKAVLTYMDRLLASLPDDKIQEFAESEHFEVYKHLFEELGLME